jgi:hypothetical protein
MVDVSAEPVDVVIHDDGDLGAEPLAACDGAQPLTDELEDPS